MSSRYLQIAEWFPVLYKLARGGCFSPWVYLLFVFSKHLRKSGWICKCSDWVCKWLLGGSHEWLVQTPGRLGGWWSAEALYSLSPTLSVKRLPPPCMTDNLWTGENDRQTVSPEQYWVCVNTLYTGSAWEQQGVVFQTSVSKRPHQLLCKPPVRGGEQFLCSSTTSGWRTSLHLWLLPTSLMGSLSTFHDV